MSAIEMFLASQYEAREASARLAAREGGEWTQVDPERYHGRIESLGGVVTYDEGSPDEYQAAHIASYDPVWALADLASKRAVLREHRSADGWDRQPDKPNAQRIRVCRCCSHSWLLDGQPRQALIGLDYPCQTVRLLAWPLRDREGWLAEWEPFGD